MKKKFNSFLRWQLLLFASFIVIVVTTDKSGIFPKGTKKIRLVEGNVVDSVVRLDPPGIAQVDKNQKVRWYIDHNAKNIDAFYIEKKVASGEIFDASEMPPDVYTKDNDRARVRSDAEDHQLYEYTIHWKNKNGNKYVHDPKIAVNPETEPPYMPMLISTVYGLSVLLLSGIFYQKFKKEAGKSIG